MKMVDRASAGLLYDCVVGGPGFPDTTSDNPTIAIRSGAFDITNLVNRNLLPPVPYEVDSECHSYESRHD
jgi:hypothetical protein